MGETFSLFGVSTMIATLFLLFFAALFSIFIPIGFLFHVEWFLFGVSFHVDFVAKLFLLFTSFVWLMSGIYATFTISKEQKAFWFWFAFTFLGNFGLCFVSDILGFYLLFSMMSLGAFGLIIHEKTKEAKEAAFVYIKYAIIGEVLLFIAMISLVFECGGTAFEQITCYNSLFILILVILSFGIKIGLFFLHSWLPLAHSFAPASASAVLSGVMLKAGVLGWIRFFPSHESGYEVVGYSLIALGILAIYGGLYGLTQNKLKSLLAYSSISQMGYIVVLFGLLLLDTQKSELLLYAILTFSAHHALNKSALFLLSAEINRYGLDLKKIALFSFFALSLIGLPFTSGAIAKEILKSGVDSMLLIALLSVGAVVTALLMLRFLSLSRDIKKITSPIAPLSPVLGLFLASLMLPWILEFSAEFSWMQMLPFFIALAISLLVKKQKLTIPLLPQGDMLTLIGSPTFAMKEKEIEQKRGEVLSQVLASVFDSLERVLRQERYIFFFLLGFIVSLSVLRLFIY
jgi:formate hydrogenlyase subunit 3/multisubunit Na+/H+ antiporter MnhD subunit